MRYLLLIVSVMISAITASAVQAEVIVPKAPDLDASAYVLMDADSGRILVEHNADERLPPASLTKMMTSYIAVHELELGNVTEQTQVPISVKAWRKGGSKMFVREGTEVALIDLLRGIIVQSGNDASVAVAEYFAGSEEAFAGWMNQYAERFGMTNTHFENATGWPAEGHLSTAGDIAKLALHIVKDHPHYYKLYAEKYYEYNDIRQPNRNKLLWRDPSVDGLKTGHTDEAGFCLAASAVRDNTRLIAVVMGTRSEEARARETQKLLAYGFRYYETRKVYNAEEVLQTNPVWLGKTETADIGLEKELYLTLPRGMKGELEVNILTDEFLEAPIVKGQVVGTLTVSMEGEVQAERPLIALSDVEEAGFFGRLWGSIKLFFARLFA
ncbi:D-alanyl-D-alanine carboxypeptidase [Thalassolituus sp. ST750PaO-4]|jgi:D-alanyl-D-alanine carboxypeptidase (penicillin-binding protein 5/6)|uniref:D-alanyl-D-alanine carboxypeptidase family protein n=2 Tax=Oceanospirillaceae TaxID=135620 RepID=UPI0011918CD4|nr:D-alanyl-D-alanine carboxypeptidase family protein [Thalassolituus sp. C2-1]MBU2038610.1 D-alanyl-D-alanine carboxypeptidase [Gammaproteobacteria bacterium]MCA6060273.1 D-alanyl-D-alanine carboxypeptidase [Thalassolituus sp. ST750PaO-4]TVV42658.1 D-alanyl-D-alanine carboxypeptidase [Thalassolituus sp. C2-1]